MNDLDEKKSKQKRPAMRLYQPPMNSIKRNESLNEGNNGKSNGKQLYVEENDVYDLKNDLKNDRLKNRSNEDKLIDNFNKKLNLNDSKLNSQQSTSNQQTNNNNLSDDEFSNMLEIYDLSPDLKSQDIRSSLYNLQAGDYEIKWVNDSRAILVFSTKSIAIEALKSPHHNLKLRKLNQGSAESKQKAREFSTDNLPFKQRPETSAFLARRLVSGALGIRVPLNKEKREAERKKIQDARDRKQEEKEKQQEREKLLKSAWDGQ